MSHSQLRGRAGTSVRIEGKVKLGTPGRRRWMPIGLQLLAMLGLAVLVYPQAANWVSTLGHQAQVSGYVRQVDSMPDPERMAAIEQAQAYNTDIPRGVLRDPYTPRFDELTVDERYGSYLQQLRVGDDDAIGEVSYPSLGISLPLYHGTTDEVISKGVGHLFGSSLPVGGHSTHAVMTSHSGLASASLFTKLPEARTGDIFTVTVLGERQFYQVRNLETVLPHETNSLQVIEGEDWITLLTCTPLNVNSHRFLVQAQRIPAPAEEGIRTVAGVSLTAIFPWWALIFLGGSALAAVLIFTPSRKKHRAGRHRLGESRASSEEAQ